MEQARRITTDQDREAERPRLGTKPAKGGEEAVRLSLVSSRETPKAAEVKIAAAIDLVRRAGTAVRAREDRAEQIENHAETFGRKAHDEMRSALARAEAAEARAAAAEKGREEAEDRLRDAEEWISRLCAVLEESSPTPSREAVRAAERAGPPAIPATRSFAWSLFRFRGIGSEFFVVAHSSRAPDPPRSKTL